MFKKILEFLIVSVVILSAAQNVNAQQVSKPSQGGTGVSTYSAGDILYAATANPLFLSKLPIGSTGNCLTVSAGTLAWGGCGSIGGSGSAGMLASWVDGTNITATSAPTAAYYTATSTTATSTFANAVTIASDTSVGGVFRLTENDVPSSKIVLGLGVGGITSDVTYTNAPHDAHYFSSGGITRVINNSGAGINNEMYGGQFIIDIQPTNVNDLYNDTSGMSGVQAGWKVRSGSTGAITRIGGVNTVGTMQSSGATVDQAYGFQYQGLAVTAGSVAYNASYISAAVTEAVNNTHWLSGTTVSPTGNYGMYEASGFQSYFSGNVGIGSTTPSTKLGVRGDVMANLFTGSRFVATSTTASVFPYASTTVISSSGNAYVDGRLGVASSSPLNAITVGGTAPTLSVGDETTNGNISAITLLGRGSGGLRMNSTWRQSADAYLSLDVNTFTRAIRVDTSTGRVAFTRGTESDYFHNGKLAIGTAAPADENAGLLVVSKGYSTATGNHHNVRVTSVDSVLEAGRGVATYDAQMNVSSTNNIDHMVDFQARGQKTGSGTANDIFGVFTQPFTSGGTVTRMQHIDINDYSGGGAVTTQYGVRVHPLFNGGTNYAFYSDGTTTPSFLAGRLGIGTTTPGTPLSVVGDGYFTGLVTGRRFVATSTDVASIFPYASTTVISNTGHAYFATTASTSVGIGTTSPTSKLHISSSLLADGTESLLQLTTTFPEVITAPILGSKRDYTTAGSSAFTISGDVVNLNAGYTGSSNTIALNFTNFVAGTGNDLVAGAANSGVSGQARATTVGDNVGGAFIARGGNTSVGVYGKANIAKASASNVGVLGIARNTSDVAVAGAFVIGITKPTFVSTALLADNGADAVPIFIARDNGIEVARIADGGNLGLGTSSPYTILSVVGEGVFRNITATSTTATSTISGPLKLGSTGTSATQGNATLVAGAVTVQTGAVTTNSYVHLTRKTSGGTIGTAITYTLANGNFTINSDNPLDTSVFTWLVTQ